MIESALRIHYRDFKDALLPQLLNRVFHVTTDDAVARIISEGAIRTNAEGQFKFTFGQSEHSYFRKRNCVSVFDLRSVTSDQIDESLNKYYFLNPPFAENRPVYMFLNACCFDRLVPWSRSQEESARSDIVIPYVEAAIPAISILDRSMNSCVLILTSRFLPLRLHYVVSRKTMHTNRAVDIDNFRSLLVRAFHRRRWALSRASYPAEQEET